MLAIISAMPDEITAVVESLVEVSTQSLGRREFHAGNLQGCAVVVVFSGWGKVAAAATTTQLIASYDVTDIVFSGVAGAVQRGLSIGDVVVGTELIQHDMDASPIFPRYEVPLLGTAMLTTDAALRARLRTAATEFLREDLSIAVPQPSRDWFRITAPKVIEGVIASGISSSTAQRRSMACGAACRMSPASTWRARPWRRCARNIRCRLASCARYRMRPMRMRRTTSRDSRVRFPGTIRLVSWVAFCSPHRRLLQSAWTLWSMGRYSGPSPIPV